MLRTCRSPILFISAFTPPTRCRPVRSRSSSWSRCVRPSACRLWRSPIPAICSARSKSRLPAPRRAFSRSLAARSLSTRNGVAEESRPERGFAEPDRIVLLAQNEVGYRNLLQLVSRSYLAGEAPTEPAITHSDLGQANEGLLCLTGGPRGPVGRLLAESQAEAAETVLTRAREPLSEPALCRADASRDTG